jgi:oligopeptide transport system ATP-binding protein
MADPVVEVEGLRKEFGDHVAVDGVSFAVQRGESLAIVGESGSGKTTVARMLVGLVRPTAGSIRVCGRERAGGRMTTAERRRRARELQIVFQDPYTSLDRAQTVAECIGEVLDLHFGLRGGERSARVAELLEHVGLGAGHAASHPRHLSGGQRQRVAIARALAASPQVLILDEAVAALDVSIQAQILNLLADIRERDGISYVFISHDLAVVRQVGDAAVVMRRGEIVERGSTADVLDRPQHAYTRLLRDSVPRPGWNPQKTEVGRGEA